MRQLAGDSFFLLEGHCFLIKNMVLLTGIILYLKVVFGGIQASVVLSASNRAVLGDLPFLEFDGFPL